MKKIKTSGELRETLLESINNVINGTLEVDQAKNITNMAKQVNDSLYSEVKVSVTKRDMGELDESKFGKLNLI